MTVDAPNAELCIEYQSVGDNGTIQVTARIGGDVLACEKLDVLRPKQRDDFAARLCRSRPVIGRAAVDAELLRIATEVSNRPESILAADAPEIELSNVIRPELFHTANVSGVTVPVMSGLGSEVRARWCLYLRWQADGRRERRELSSAIEMPGGGRLWAHPVPGEPSPTMTCAWSAAARREWLQHSAAPDPCDVFRRICERIAYYLDFPPESAGATTALLALWVLFTYVFPAWVAVPYLCIGGPLGSGKTTLFRVLERLVFRPLSSSNMTAPCLFRTLHEHGGTLLLDEAERLRDRSPEAGELRSILLSGYKPGSPARRLEKQGDSFVQVAFDVYGPKAMASIASPPEALASRCIQLMMFRAGPASEKPRRRIDANPAEWQSIRNDLHVLALEHGPTWAQLAERSDVVPAALAGREYELWQPILSLASWLNDGGARGLLVMLQKHAEAMASERRDEATPEADETLLRIIAEAVVEGRQGSLKAGHVLKRAQELDPATFDKWSPKGIGATLARYGLRTTKGRGNTGRTFTKVTVTDLRRIEAAYGLDLDQSGENVPTCTERTDKPAPEVEERGFSVGT